MRVFLNNIKVQFKKENSLIDNIDNIDDNGCVIM